MKWLALAVSVGAHALVLWWFSSAEVVRAPARVSTPVSIDVVEVRAPQQAAAQGEGPARPAPVKRSRAPVATATAPVAEVAALAAPAEFEPALEAAPAFQEAERSSGGEAAPAQLDVDALVHARLTAAAERCYPAAARRFRQRGTVKLSFCAGPQGAVIDAAIRESSGASLLDAAAQGCVLAQATPLPAEAASRCFSVPVRFGAP